MLCYVYKTTNLITKKIYIGKRSRKNNRFGKNYFGSGKIISAAIKKYGIENFTKEVIEYCEVKLLNEREKYWIAYFNSTDKTIGYNITNGGDGGYTGPAWNLGKSLSEEHRRKVSENHADISGINNPMYGKKHTEESKLKAAQTRRENPYKHTESARRRMSQRGTGENNQNSKLTNEIVMSIRNDHSTLSLSKITKKYNIKKAYAWKIIKRITWKHI